MAKKQAKKNKKNQKVKSNTNAPWIQMRTGLIIMTIVSIGMAIIMGWPAYQALGLEGILWGIGFGVAIWVIFFGAIYLNRLLRGNRD
jgi:hypothetical protein